MTAQLNKLSVYFVSMAALCLCATFLDRPSVGAESPMVQGVEPTGNKSGDPILSPRGRIQGPALDEPKELFAMLEQRKEFLAKKEDSLRLSEERLTTLKKEVEQSLTRFEQAVKAADGNRKAVQDKLARAEADEQRNAQAHLVKMYESMPAEDAAVRIEKMPQSKALDLLRLLKGKTAGAILASVKPDQAAKLTERLIGSQPKQKK